MRSSSLFWVIATPLLAVALPQQPIYLSTKHGALIPWVSSAAVPVPHSNDHGGALSVLRSNAMTYVSITTTTSGGAYSILHSNAMTYPTTTFGSGGAYSVLHSNAMTYPTTTTSRTKAKSVTSPTPTSAGGALSVFSSVEAGFSSTSSTGTIVAASEINSVLQSMMSASGGALSVFNSALKTYTAKSSKTTSTTTSTPSVTVAGESTGILTSKPYKTKHNVSSSMTVSHTGPKSKTTTKSQTQRNQHPSPTRAPPAPPAQQNEGSCKQLLITLLSVVLGLSTLAIL